MKLTTTLSVLVVGFLLGTATTTLSATMRGSNVFADVTYGSYFDEAVGEMNTLGIIKGYDTGKFGPNDYVTRAQVAVLMKRLRDEILGISSGTVHSSATSSVASTSSSSSSSSQSSVATTTNQNGTFRFTTANYNVNEDKGTATISIIRAGGSTGIATVEYKAIAGNAEAGTDFEIIEGKITFAAGKTSGTFEITILDDDESEDNETIKLTLFSPTGGAILGTPIKATLTIKDNEESASSSSAGTTQAGEFNFNATGYKVSEKGGSIDITVIRKDGSIGSATVDYATSNGTASFSNYSSTNGTLSFANGEKEKTFSITINDNASIGGNKTINLTLSEPTNTAILGENKATVLVIHDDEVGSFGTGSIKFTSNAFDGSEFEGKAVITVERQGGTVGEVAIDYATQDSTAKKASDYTETSGTLTFYAGEYKKSFIVPITKDTQPDANEKFTIELTNPTGGASLSSPSITTVTVQ